MLGNNNVWRAIKLIFSPVALTLFVFCSASFAQPVKTGVVTYDVDTGGSATGSDYYGSGNDDAFGEYGVTTFNYTLADFGGSLSDIANVRLSLTVNDRTFSDGNMVEFFYTPDTDVSGLSFDDSVVNGIDPSQFTTAPVSLGVFAIQEMAGRPGGEVDNFQLNFDASATASLLNSINAGTDFQIIVAATLAEDDITYSGVGNTFDPGDPTLKIRPVPEPGSLALLLVGLLPLLRRLR